MPTRQNRYFNNPQMAAAFSNLAGIFAPPSAQDFYMQSRTEGQDFQNEAQRRAFAALTAEGVTPADQDRFGVAMTTFGQGFNPTQTNRAVDIASADRRYGVDVSAQNALDVQGLRNEQSGRETAFGAMVSPQGRQGISDDDIVAMLGIEGLPGFSAQGPVAPTAPQVAGADRLRLQESGLLTDEMLAAEIMGNTPVENIATEDGPRIAYRTDAVGQEPYINRGAEARPQLNVYRTPDGRSGTARFDEQQGWVDTQTGEVLPAGSITGEIQDTVEGLGGQGEVNQILQAESSLDSAELLVRQIRPLVSSDGQAVSGVAGAVNQLFNDVPQAAAEIVNTLNARFGDDENQVVTPEAIAALGQRAPAGYDSTQTQARNLLLRLAYMQARIDNSGAPVGVRAVERAIESIGASGVLSSNAKINGVLDNFEQTIQNERLVNQRRLERARTGQATTPLTGQGSVPQAGGAEAVPDGVDPQLWQFLTPEERALFR
jgi:hypothetical protein